MRWNFVGTIFLIFFVLFTFEQDGIIALNAESYDEYIKNTSIILVYYYAKGCASTCTILKAQLRGLTKLIKEKKKPYAVAELNTTAYPEQADKHNVTEIPSLKLFFNSIPIDYKKDTKSFVMLAYIDRKVGAPYKDLFTLEEVQKEKDEIGLRCFLIGGNSTVITVYAEVARGNDDFRFFRTSLDLAKQAFGDVEENDIIIVKDFDEGMEIYKGNIRREDIVEFINTKGLPTVSEITEKIVGLMEAPNSKTGIFLFRKPLPEMLDIEREFHEVAMEYRNEDIIFVHTDIKEGYGLRVSDFFYIYESLLPFVGIIKIAKESLMYVHNGTLKADQIIKFIENYKKGDIKRYYKSELIPTENKGPVYKLVSKNFYHEVFDNDLDIVVNFAAAWCGNCKELNDNYTVTAENITSEKENKMIKFFTIETTKNEVEGFNVTKFPAIKLFPGKNKTNVAHLGGLRKHDEIFKFVAGNCSYPIVVPEKAPPTEEEKEKSKEDL